MFHIKQSFKKITLLFTLILLCVFSQNAFCQNTYNKEQIDSIAKYKKQNPRNLIKVFYSFGRPNTPWLIPNGLSYEGIWGKKTTYGGGVIFRSGSNLNNWDVAVYAEARYYLHRKKNNHTFKGFFFNTGLVHFQFNSPTLLSNITGVIAGFGYQTMVYKNLSFESFITTDIGCFRSETYLAGYLFPPAPYKEKFDAFRWGQLGFRFGYAF
jgi:hypothetical protein